MTRTWSAPARADRRWVTSRTPREASASSRSATRRSAVGASRCSPGSSRSMRGAGAARARASRSRRRSPPDRVVASGPMRVSSPSGRASSQGPSPARASRAAASGRLTEPRATRRFSRTEVEKTWASSAVRLTRPATSSRAAPQGAAPSRVTSPARGWSMPARVSRSVVLPMPEGPTTASRSPGPRSRSMPWAAMGPPGQPTARPRARSRLPPIGAGGRGSAGPAVLASARSVSSTIRTAAPAEAMSWTAAGPRAAVASKADRGTRTMTASHTPSRAPEATAGRPVSRLPSTARPAAAASMAAAAAAGRPARSRAAARRCSRSSRSFMTAGMRPATLSSPPCSRAVSSVADRSAACSVRASSAARAERIVTRGPAIPASSRQAPRARPAGGWIRPTARAVSAPVPAATAAGSQARTTRSPTASTSAPTRASTSPRRRPATTSAREAARVW